MTIQLSNDFIVPAPIGDAWALLSDVPTVASCLPGATITSVDEFGRYSGSIGVKVGPISMKYRGTIEILDCNDEQHTIRLRGSGKDSSGAGTASATIELSAHSVGNETKASVTTNLDVTGRVAQFGASAMQPVAARMVDQFVANLGNKINPSSERTPAAKNFNSAPATAAMVGLVSLVVGIFWWRRKAHRVDLNRTSN